MAKLRTLIIHPDPAIRADLRRRLGEVAFLQVLGEAVGAFEALELLEHVHYGVFFLGAELDGEMSGVELARMLSGRKDTPALVFLASGEEHAYAAFEHGALDYLLWPPSDGRFDKTLERLREFKARYREIPEPGGEYTAYTDEDAEDEGERTLQLPLGEDEDAFLAALRQAWDQSQTRGPEIEKLAVNQDGRMILVPYTQVIFVEAYEDYSYVHTANQKLLTSYRLKALEERLKPHRFFRVHRKYLVNLEMVTEIASLPGQNFMLRTMGKTRIELPISRRRIAELKQILGL